MNRSGIENRKSPRFTVRMSAEVRHGGAMFTASTRDLSLGGVCLECDRVLPEGNPVQVNLFVVVDDIEDATQPSVDMNGRVAWAAPGDEGRRSTMGIRFEGISASQLSGLTRFVRLIPPG